MRTQSFLAATCHLIYIFLNYIRSLTRNNTRIIFGTENECVKSASTLSTYLMLDWTGLLNVHSAAH